MRKAVDLAVLKTEFEIVREIKIRFMMFYFKIEGRAGKERRFGICTCMG